MAGLQVSTAASNKKAYLVLRDKSYFMESEDQQVIKTFTEDVQIQHCLVQLGDTDTVDPFFLSREIITGKLIILLQRCFELECPLISEYEYLNDFSRNYNIALKEDANLHPHQKQSLLNIFVKERARSGIVVLPRCAGKRLVGVAACCTIRKRSLIVCSFAETVDIWKNQFKTWSTADDVMIFRFSPTTKKTPNDNCCILISTYSMLTKSKHSSDAARIMSWLENQEWGILVLDEVQTVPSATFQKVIRTVKAHCKLGVTSSFAREDGKLDDLEYLVGPELYKGNRKDLEVGGFITRVTCYEILCAMSEEFQCEYTKRGTPTSKKILLAAMNPNKIRTCEYLIRHNEQKNRRTIVFVDSLDALLLYANFLELPFITGQTPANERHRILAEFENGIKKTVLMSKVGDTFEVLPCAHSVIQISSHGASRRQEAQRIGLLLDTKKSPDEQLKGRFYSLISVGTDDEKFAE